PTQCHHAARLQDLALDLDSEEAVEPGEVRDDVADPLVPDVATDLSGRVQDGRRRQRDRRLRIPGNDGVHPGRRHISRRLLHRGYPSIWSILGMVNAAMSVMKAH